MLSQKLNKVLCINDSELTLFIIKRMIDKAMFSEEVIEAADGLEALNYCEQLIQDPAQSEKTYPNLIFLDLHMPKMDGWEFLDHFSRTIHPYFKNTKVVITSHSIDTNDSDRVRNYPFIIDFLRNPMSIEYLYDLKDRLSESDLLLN